MKQTSKKGKSKAAQQRRPARATPAQVMRQIGLLLLIVAIWAVLLVGYLRLTTPSETPVAELPQPTEAVATPQPTQTLTPTEEPADPTATQPAPTPTTEPALPVTATESVTTAPPSPTVAPTESEPSPSPTVAPTETEPPPSPTDTPTPPGAATVSFSEDVLPLFRTRCERCHGDSRAEAGLNLLSYASVMAGSEDGPVVIPGSSATSYLVELIVAGEMPRRAPSLPPAEIETISTWVDEGALDN